MENATMEDGGWRHFYLVSGPKAQCKSPSL